MYKALLRSCAWDSMASSPTRRTAISTSAVTTTKYANEDSNRATYCPSTMPRHMKKVLHVRYIHFRNRALRALSFTRLHHPQYVCILLLFLLFFIIALSFMRKWRPLHTQGVTKRFSTTTSNTSSSFRTVRDVDILQSILPADRQQPIAIFNVTQHPDAVFATVRINGDKNNNHLLFIPLPPRHPSPAPPSPLHTSQHANTPVDAMGTRPSLRLLANAMGMSDDIVADGMHITVRFPLRVTGKAGFGVGGGDEGRREQLRAAHQLHRIVVTAARQATTDLSAPKGQRRRHTPHIVSAVLYRRTASSSIPYGNNGKEWGKGSVMKAKGGGEGGGGGSLQPVSILHTPGDDPHAWRPVLPTADMCRRGVVRDGGRDSRGNWESCNRVLDIMLLAAVAGCRPPSDIHFLTTYVASRASSATTQPSSKFHEDGMRTPTVTLGLPDGCFGDGGDGEEMVSYSIDEEGGVIAGDVWKTYVIAMCDVPSALVGRLRGLQAISWGVGGRALQLARWLEDVQQEGGLSTGGSSQRGDCERVNVY